MKRAWLSVCMSGFLLLASQASATVTSLDDGNAVLEKCTSQNQFDQGMCYGLITGYFEGMQVAYTCSKVYPNINRQQIKDVVVTFLQDYSADRHLPGATSAWRAFYVAFDCKANIH